MSDFVSGMLSPIDLKQLWIEAVHLRRLLRLRGLVGLWGVADENCGGGERNGL